MLTHLAENVWIADHTLTLALGVPMPTRMTVVRLDDGALALLSPVPIDDALAAELEALGAVGHVIAPNSLHHLHVEAALQRFPEARLWGPKALEKKHPQLRFEPLGAGWERAAGDALVALPVDGASRISETVLFHPTSKTLIVTDLVFNVVEPPSWSTALMLAFTGTRGRLAQSRVWSVVTDDEGAAKRSCERILACGFDRLVVAHGNVIETGAKAPFASALTRTGPGTDLALAKAG
jgi:hypothetical protein